MLLGYEPLLEGGTLSLTDILFHHLTSNRVALAPPPERWPIKIPASLTFRQWKDAGFLLVARVRRGWGWGGEERGVASSPRPPFGRRAVRTLSDV
jgi:hypothetical protein